MIVLQGDILFLHMSKDPVRAGEIVVFNIDVCSFFLAIHNTLFFNSTRQACFSTSVVSVWAWT